MQQLLQNKNILLFVPNGRGNYGTAIEKELNQRGANTWVFDERPSSSTISKIIVRLAKNSLESFFISYLEKILEECKGIDFDFVIIIRAEAFTPSSIKFLKSKVKNAFFILYLWDSIKNTDASSILPFFDRVLSFDKYDAEKFNLMHRPLFFINFYRDIAKIPPADIDVLFVAKLHSDRFRFAKSYESALLAHGFSAFFFFYLQSKILFYKMKIENSDLKQAKLSDISFKPLPATKVADLMQRSRVSLDAQHPSQTGLTMRTLEVLGAKRKLITTNKEIVNYDFFNPDNIMVVDRNEVKIDPDFIHSPFTDLPESIYEKYSIQGWLDDLLGTTT